MKQEALRMRAAHYTVCGASPFLLGPPFRVWTSALALVCCMLRWKPNLEVPDASLHLTMKLNRYEDSLAQASLSAILLVE
jgi:hypothetical protein